MENKGIEDKRKHLEMIQAVINRMASNSFVFKGWSVTIIAGISAFAAQDTHLAILFIPVGATLLFWAVDAYYLMLERAFRGLYDEVAKKNRNQIDYSMKVTGIGFCSWFKTFWTRPILILFYGTVLVLLGVLYFVLSQVSIHVTVTHGS